MNPELPKSVLDALARETAPANHPSADVLAAFAERTLGSEENRRVTEHVARCGECRETVFLARNAAEQEAEVKQRRLVAAAAPQDISQPAAKAAQGWWRRLAWAMPLAAVLLIAAGVLVWQQTRRTAQEPELASMAARKSEERQAVTVPEATAGRTVREGVMESPARKPEAKTSLAKRGTPVAPDASAEVSNSLVASAPVAGVSVNNAAPRAADEVGRSAVGGPIGAVPVPAPQSDSRAFAVSSSKSGNLSYAPSASSQIVLNRTAPKPLAEARAHEWRVTPEGHLERLTGSGWSRVLANETAIFRVVAVISNDVWAGGAGGALFHSSDGGQEWKATALSEREIGTVVSIKFDDTKHGMVATEDGKRWSTSDGGATWVSQ